MANFAKLHDDMLEYEIQLVRIMENLEEARRKMVTRRATNVMTEAADLVQCFFDNHILFSSIF